MSERFPRVLLVDSGVDDGHPGLRGGSPVEAWTLDAAGGLEREVPARDPLGHGTAVAAVLRAANPRLAIVSLRVFDARGEADPVALALALRASMALSFAVANCSLGLPRSVFADVAETDLLAAAAALAATRVLVVPAFLANGLPNALAGVAGAHAVVEDPNHPVDRPPREGPVARTWLASPLPPAGLVGLPATRVRGSSLACARVAAFLAAGGSAAG